VPNLELLVERDVVAVSRKRVGGGRAHDPRTDDADVHAPILLGSVRAMTWEPYRGSSVVGDVRVLRGERDLYAYLPTSHGSGRRFPLLVMHDGLNLFDEPLSNDGEWQVDETMEALAAEGLEAVVIGVPHGPDRGDEYAGAGAAAYLHYLADTVVPLARESFDVDPQRQATGLVGSSLGGAISLQGVYAERETFALAGVFSPAFWYGDGPLFDIVANEDPPAARVYMDVGTKEDEDEDISRKYADDFERMRDLLAERGVDLHAVLDEGGIHHETAWARRLPDALRFLLA
jgi:predicted alpha/beta superfamily hydrolase